MSYPLKISAIALCILWSAASAQETAFSVNGQAAAHYPVPDSLIRAVLTYNRTLLAAYEQYRVSALEASTGINPPDPRVELGYLYGKPADMGNRFDFSLSQEIDFPTSYVHRSRSRDLQISQAGLHLQAVRQQVVLEAVRLWIERIYLIQLEGLLLRRVELAQKQLVQADQKVSLGESGQLALSQSNLQATALRGELERTRTAIRANLSALQVVTGGITPEIPGSALPASRPPDPDSLWPAYQQGPEMQLYKREVERRQQLTSLAASMRLPRLSAGYYSESVAAEQFRGFQVGVSVPLWEHSNRIKLARSEVSLAEAEADRVSLQMEEELRQKAEQWKSLDRQISEMEQALARVNDMELLTIAMEGGEISLTEYMLGTDLYFRNQQTLLSLKKERLLLEAEMRRIYY